MDLGFLGSEQPGLCKVGGCTAGKSEIAQHRGFFVSSAWNYEQEESRSSSTIRPSWSLQLGNVVGKTLAPCSC